MSAWWMLNNSNKIFPPSVYFSVVTAWFTLPLLSGSPPTLPVICVLLSQKKAACVCTPAAFSPLVRSWLSSRGAILAPTADTSSWTWIWPKMLQREIRNGAAGYFTTPFQSKGCAVGTHPPVQGLEMKSKEEWQPNLLQINVCLL